MTRVSLAPQSYPNASPPNKPNTSADAILPPGINSEAEVILGWKENDFSPVTPTPTTLFGPRGVLLHPNGSLWVCDTGHHRVLGWKHIPKKDNTPADIVLGQEDFFQEGRNGKKNITRSSVNVPTGITAYGLEGGLAVADAWNHRILIWKKVPEENNQPADLILGNPETSVNPENRRVDRSSLYWPYGLSGLYGLSYSSEKLFVADTGNRRVLVWNEVHQDQQPADRVLGQKDFFSRDENAGDNVGSGGMRWPHDIAVWHDPIKGKDNVLVADAGNNRIMIWSEIPEANGSPCDAVLGQGDFHSCDHNRGNYLPSADCLNMPYGMTIGSSSTHPSLWVNDTANSRILIWDDLNQQSARFVIGQPDFKSKGDNQWKPANRKTLCWPYGVSIGGSINNRQLTVADSGNNRILIWNISGDE